MAKGFTDVNYVAVSNESTSSFRNPRQKLWGVFVKNWSDILRESWKLCLITTDLEEAKAKAQEWLKFPPSANNSSATIFGINGVIVSEILPVDAFVTA